MVLISTGQMSLLVQMYDISTLTLHITLWDHTFGTIRIDEVKFDMASKQHNAVSTGFF